MTRQPRPRRPGRARRRRQRWPGVRGRRRRRRRSHRDRGRGVRHAEREELDGRGRVLAPGFIDPHTHLDANLFWDPDVTPCSSYGVTTVVTGNCGYALAPIADDAARDYVVDALCTVEQIAARRGRRQRRTSPPAPRPTTSVCSTELPVLCNFATLVGHVPVRTAVLGPGRRARARRYGRRESRASPSSWPTACALGALGFSTDQVVGNYGPAGGALPGQVCDDDELLAVARVLGEMPGPGSVHDGAACADPGPRRARGRSRMARPARGGERQARGGRAGVRPVVRPRCGVRPRRPHRSAVAPRRAAWCPRSRRGCSSCGPASTCPGCSCARFPPCTRRSRPTAPTVRGAWPATSRRRRATARGSRPRRAVAHLVGSVGARRGAVVTEPPRSLRSQRSRPRDRMVRASGRRAARHRRSPTTSRRSSRRAWRTTTTTGSRGMVAHPAAMIGASDAGAHVLSNTDSCYAVWTLQHWVRERGVLTLEHAVRKLTADQADLLGFADRGRVASRARRRPRAVRPRHGGHDRRALRRRPASRRPPARHRRDRYRGVGGERSGRNARGRAHRCPNGALPPAGSWSGSGSGVAQPVKTGGSVTSSETTVRVALTPRLPPPHRPLMS